MIAATAGGLSRATGRGGGTSLPGMVLNRLEPGALARLGGGLGGGAVCISATNGKTTTARLLSACLRAAGRDVAANAAGANLASGVTAALLARQRRRRAARDSTGCGGIGVFEVDEAALGQIADALGPRAVVLMNLFRDQLDRYGELEAIAARWAEVARSLGPATTMVLNADDPALAHLGSLRTAETDNVVLFGIDDPAVGRPELPHAADAVRCGGCGGPLSHDLITVGHLGHWRCDGCGVRRPQPHISARRVRLAGLDRLDLGVNGPGGAELELSAALGGLHNAYNVTAAVAAATALGVPAEAIGNGIGEVRAAFGRAEQVSLDGRRLRLLLAKNPTGANENIRCLMAEPAPLNLLVVLNDRTADGRDPSWIWDVDYEPLWDRLGSVTLAGDRCWDLALRFSYGGLGPARFAVRESLADALDSAVAATPPGGALYALPTYTALLELRAELVRRGAAHDFWQES
ncbi:MAG: DUF1727 domain-containing protein [Acidimicrobiia bacterium]|nr:DUF1727 domain-containing protein [Acidimicrobiia bacterium]